MSEPPLEIHVRVSRPLLRRTLIVIAVILILSLIWFALQTVGTTHHKG